MLKSRLAVAAAALLVAGSAYAQEQPAPEQVQGWIQELQEIQVRLAPVQQEALQDSAIAEEQQRTSDAVRAAMVAADPTIDAAITRFEQLLAEARTAQESGDAEKIAALTREAQQLQPRIESAQTEAMAQPAVAERVAVFQQRLHARMIDIDPDVQPLLERAGQLEERIAAAMRS